MLCERLGLDIDYLSIWEEKVYWKLEADVNSDLFKWQTLPLKLGNCVGSINPQALRNRMLILFLKFPGIIFSISNFEDVGRLEGIKEKGFRQGKWWAHLSETHVCFLHVVY